ncbi:MAG: acyl-CoA dehydrogenase [Flavobacteriaceae bacterium]|nr:acyl-CoA dehydrogenase [Flavobacteriaceae bacterium]|tara:strand:+ start:69625 stop:71424 length:1800 start_codon:yes stop_codon:yes gene_type:complete
METNQKSVTIGGSFIIKESNLNDIFTPEDFTEEHKMMKDSVIEFVDREIVPKRQRFEKKDYKLTEEIMSKIGELGFLGVSVPEKYGGLGMGFVSTMLVCDYISGASGSISTAFGAHTGIGILPIVLYGTEDQKQKYLPNLASGKWIGSYCLTEPGSGSDANSGKTKAVLSDDGSYYKISGQKMWISNAGFASLFIVFARIEDDKNITGFLIPNEPSNGITLGDEENKLGIHSSSTRQVFFNETKVPVENMLGERQQGFKIAMNALNVGRVKLGVACLEAQRRVITEAVKYSNERIQFKSPISSFGAIKEKISQMATSCYIGESACYRAAKDIENRTEVYLSEGMSHQESELKGVEDFAIECSLIKIGISEDIMNCTDEGIQIFGGMGFSAEAPMESAWRDARIGRIYEGTNEINRMLSVGMLLKKGMKGQINLMEAVMNAKSDLLKNLQIKDLPNNVMSNETQLLINLKKIFLILIGKAAEKYGQGLDKKQQVLMSLSDILIEIYLIDSGLKRTIKNINRSDKESQSSQIKMTQLYLYEANEIILKKSKDIIYSTLEGEEKLELLDLFKKSCDYKTCPNIFALKTEIANKIINENKYCF